MTDLGVTLSGVTLPTNTSGTLYVYEDVGDGGGANSVTVDGTTIHYDNVASAALVGGQTAYTLSGFDASSGNRIWPRYEIDNTDDVSTAELVEATDISGAATAPTAPSGLTVAWNATTASVDGSFTDASSGSGQEDEFRVYRSTAASPTFPSDYSLRDTLPTDATTFSDQDFAAETYSYVVTAVNSAGESAPSNADSVTLTEGTAQATTALPDVTTGSITPVDASVEDELTVPNAGVSNYGSLDYEIRIAGSGSAYGDRQTVAHDGSAVTFAGLLDGESYDIRARTRTEHVDGAWVSVSEVTLLPADTNLTNTDRIA